MGRSLKSTNNGPPPFGLAPYFMNLITSTAKRPSPLLPCLLLGLVLASGCDATKSTVISGPTPREAELTKTVAELRSKLTAAEQAAEQAKAQTAVALAQLKNTPAPQAKAEPVPVADSAAAASPQGTDTTYVVAKKTFTPGELISTATGAYPNATERRPAEYWITFKGVQTGKEYPALAVKEAAYSEFREGVDYTQQDLNQAKTTAPASDATGTLPKQ